MSTDVRGAPPGTPRPSPLGAPPRRTPHEVTPTPVGSGVDPQRGSGRRGRSPSDVVLVFVCLDPDGPVGARSAQIPTTVTYGS